MGLRNKQMIVILLRLAGAVAAVLILQISPVPHTLIEAVQAGRRAAETGIYPRAAELFHLAAEYQPYVPEHWSAAAEAELMAGELAAAEADLNRLALLRPLRAEEMGWLGAVYAAQGRVDDAITVWEQGRLQGPDDLRSLYGLANAYVDRRDWGKARLVLEALAQLAPADPEVLYRLALLEALDQPEQAALTVAALLVLEPQRAEQLRPLQAHLSERADQPPDLAYARLGVVYLGLEELPLANEALTRAIAYNPAYGQALAYMAYVRVRLGLPALGAAQQAQALAPDDPVVLYLVGLVWKQLGRPAEARAIFMQGFRVDPSNPALAVEIASTYQAERSLEWAEAWFEEAARLAPEGEMRFRLLLAQFYADEAYQLGERGLPLAQSLVAEAPDSAEAHEVLGWAYFQAGDYQQATEELEQALALDPTLARAYLHMGMVLEAGGQPENAVWYYTRASEIEPDGPYGLLARRALERIQGG
jgi:tetratricopeptide (TPR) repeat protein